ncbi:MAG: hypothetical protein P1V51_13615 [Deltaproteobacteria bacterium]|nr:hypothetical protein [Deltaproteobacteria bacterium]
MRSLRFIPVPVLALALVAGCPSSPTADELRVSCREDADCSDLATHYGEAYSCDVTLELCVSTLPAGDGGQDCNPPCSGGQVCEAGSCVDPGLRVKIVSPLAGEGFTDRIPVSAEVTPAGFEIASVTCQANELPTVDAAFTQRGQIWGCELPLAGLDSIAPVTITVRATDHGGGSALDSVQVIRDTIGPRVTLRLYQSGTGELDASSETWPTEVDGHGPLQIEVTVEEQNLPEGGLSVELPRKAGLTAFAPAMECIPAGSTHTCQGTLLLKAADFPSPEARGEQVVYVTATDVAGNSAETSGRFNIDAQPPVLTDHGCTGDAVDGQGTILRDARVDCSVEVAEAETGLEGSPIASLPNTAAVAISVSPAALPLWKVSLDLTGHGFDLYEGLLPFTVEAKDVWGNTARQVLDLEATRLRWTVDLGNPLLSPALGTDANLYVVSNDGPGSATLHVVNRLSGEVQSGRTIPLNADTTVLAGPVIQHTSDGTTELHLLTSDGAILTQTPLGATNWSSNRPGVVTGFQSGYRSLPVISADGDFAYAVVERVNQNLGTYLTSLEAIGEDYTGAGACATGGVAIPMASAGTAGFTARDASGTGSVTAIYAADQLGNAIYGACAGCNCAANLDAPAPARWGAIAAFPGGFLYPSIDADPTAGLDAVEWGTWDPVDGALLPAWVANRLTGPTLTGGPVHDGERVYAGASTGVGIDLMSVELYPPHAAQGNDYGDVSILDIVLAQNGTQWVLRKPAASNLELVNLATGTALQRWTGILGGLDSFPRSPEIERPGMLLEPETRSLVVPHGRFLSSVIVDSQVTAGWPMSRADPKRTACLP